MTCYDLNTEGTYVLSEHFWKELRVGDVVNGREVVREAKDTSCGWPQVTDLMSDEGRGWMVCRAGFDEPACGCPHETFDDMEGDE